MPPDTTRAPSPASVSAIDQGVLDRPSLVEPEGLFRSQLECDGLAGDDVHQRTALRAREDVPN